MPQDPSIPSPNALPPKSSILLGKYAAGALFAVLALLICGLAYLFSEHISLSQAISAKNSLIASDIATLTSRMSMSGDDLLSKLASVQADILRLSNELARESSNSAKLFEEDASLRTSISVVDEHTRSLDSKLDEAVTSLRRDMIDQSTTHATNLDGAVSSIRGEMSELVRTEQLAALTETRNAIVREISSQVDTIKSDAISLVRSSAITSSQLLSTRLEELRLEVIKLQTASAVLPSLSVDSAAAKSDIVNIKDELKATALDLASRATKIDLDALSKVVTGKASQSDLDKLSRQVMSLSTTISANDQTLRLLVLKSLQAKADKATVDNLASALDAAVLAASAATAKLSAEMTTALDTKSDKVSLDNLLRTVNGALDSINSISVNLESKASVDDLKASIVDVKGLIGLLEVDVSSNTSTIGDLSTAVAGLSSTLQSTIGNITDSSVNVQSALGALQDAVAKLTDALSLKTDLDEFNQLSASTHKAIADISDIRRTAATREDLQTSLDKLGKSLEDSYAAALRAMRSDVDAESATISSRVDAMSTTLSSAVLSIAESRDALSTLSSKTTGLISNIRLDLSKLAKDVESSGTATADSIASINTAAIALKTVVDSKASQADLSAMASTIAGKASMADVDTIRKAIAALKASTASSSDVDALRSELSELAVLVATGSESTNTSSGSTGASAWGSSMRWDGSPEVVLGDGTTPSVLNYAVVIKDGVPTPGYGNSFTGTKYPIAPFRTFMAMLYNGERLFNSGSGKLNATFRSSAKLEFAEPSKGWKSGLGAIFYMVNLSKVDYPSRSHEWFSYPYSAKLGPIEADTTYTNCATTTTSNTTNFEHNRTSLWAIRKAYEAMILETFKRKCTMELTVTFNINPVSSWAPAVVIPATDPAVIKWEVDVPPLNLAVDGGALHVSTNAVIHAKRGLLLPNTTHTLGPGLYSHDTDATPSSAVCGDNSVMVGISVKGEGVNGSRTFNPICKPTVPYPLNTYNTDSYYT